MNTLVSTAAGAADWSAILDWIAALNDHPIARWAPMVLFLGGLMWLAVLTHRGHDEETLNERVAREVEEAWR